MTNENSKNKTKFRLINGGRDELEKELVRALFSIDNGEVERISNLLKPRQLTNESKLRLVSKKPKMP